MSAKKNGRKTQMYHRKLKRENRGLSLSEIFGDIEHDKRQKELAAQMNRAEYVTWKILGIFPKRLFIAG